jgi:hypothetical protein
MDNTTQELAQDFLSALMKRVDMAMENGATEGEA